MHEKKLNFDRLKLRIIDDKFWTPRIKLANIEIIKVKLKGPSSLAAEITSFVLKNASVGNLRYHDPKPKIYKKTKYFQNG